MDERLDILQKDLDRLKHVIDGNGEEGLRHQVSELREVMFGGTARVPKEKGLQFMVQDTNDVIRDTRTRLGTVSALLRWVGAGTLGGLLAILASVRGWL